MINSVFPSRGQASRLSRGLAFTLTHQLLNESGLIDWWMRQRVENLNTFLAHLKGETTPAYTGDTGDIIQADKPIWEHCDLTRVHL